MSRWIVSACAFALRSLVHDELLEGEEPQVEICLDGPPLLCGDHSDDGFEKALQILVIRYRIRIRKIGERDSEPTMEVLRECRIDQRVIISCPEHVP
jgi:hypothetical protein